MTTIPTFLVTIDTPGEAFDVEVPTFQGPEAAGRRAFFAIAARNPRLDMDRITVRSVEAI